MSYSVCMLLCCAFSVPPDPGPVHDLREAVKAVRAVGPNGEGAMAAQGAWKVLAKAEISQLPDLLSAMDGATPLAKNWLRSALSEVLSQAKSSNQELPRAQLEAFLKDQKHDALARRLCFELLKDIDASIPDRFLPEMLNDPSSELRRAAVARLMNEAEGYLKGEKKEQAIPFFQKAFQSARDQDQISALIKKLKELGKPADAPLHLGLVLEWKVIGPFPNSDGNKDIDTVYPPEKGLDFAAVMEGKPGEDKKPQSLAWKDYVSKNELGLVNLTELIGSPSNTICYAAANFQSSEARNVEIRLGAFNAFKLWVNGEVVLVRGDAYTGMKLDHYVAKAKLKAGTNTILIKLAQDTPPPQLPKMLQFQLRVCDRDGVAILSTDRAKGNQ